MSPVVDLATMREAVTALGGDPEQGQPLSPAEMVIDHWSSWTCSAAPTPTSATSSWNTSATPSATSSCAGARARSTTSRSSPGTGIVHQVNIEYLARTVMVRNGQAYPDTCVGTDSHTTMENGLGVLGWGVGGIEAEAAMLGQPVSMLIPRVVGFKLTGEIQPGVTATDVVLTVTDMLRKHGVVGKFVEFYGKGVAEVPLANRATLGNMSPEFGSTCAIFPIDEETINYLRLTGRDDQSLALVEAYARSRACGTRPTTSRSSPNTSNSTWPPSSRRSPAPSARRTASCSRSRRSPSARTSTTTSRRADPGHHRCRGVRAGCGFAELRRGGRGHRPVGGRRRRGRPTAGPRGRRGAREFIMDHGAVVVCGITSCTNTSNPSVMLGAALLAKKAVEKGLSTKPWVKTNMAPVRRSSPTTTRRPACGRTWRSWASTSVVTAAPRASATPARCRADLRPSTTTICRSRRFCRATVTSRAASPRRQDELPGLAAAGHRLRLAGTMDFDFESSRSAPAPTATTCSSRTSGRRRRRSTTPSNRPSARTCSASPTPMCSRVTSTGATCPPRRATPSSGTSSTYVRKAPYFDGMTMEPAPVKDIKGARVMAVLGDSVTTDHISPAGPIKPGTPAAQYLDSHGVARDYNSLGSRRGNHEVMIRGTFANIRLQNQLLDGVSGGYTRDFTQEGGRSRSSTTPARTTRRPASRWSCSAAREYGSGSSRDWAAKGTVLLGVRPSSPSRSSVSTAPTSSVWVWFRCSSRGRVAQVAGSGRHRGHRHRRHRELNEGITPATMKVTATKEDGSVIEFDAKVRIDTR